MEFCDFTGDSDFEQFMPTRNASQDSMKSNDDNDNLDSTPGYCYCPPDESDLQILRDKQLRGRGYRYKYRKPCNKKTSVNNDSEYSCFPTETCCGMETTVSEQFPPRYSKIKATNPFAFLMTGGRTAKSTMRKATAVINPNECCNHDEPSGSRKFILQFDKQNAATISDRSDSCYVAEKDRCTEFWEFVNGTPELEKIIKDGTFFHNVPPKEVDKSGHPLKEVELQSLFKAIRKSKDISKYSPEMEALRQRNIKVREEEKKRREKLRERIKIVQEKSGQKYRMGQLNYDDGSKKPCGHLADCSNPSPGEVLEEMEYFDELSSNPVQVGCKFRKRRQSCKEIFMPFGDDAGEGAYSEGEQ
ncbi:hypothetical protein Ocin01_08417 [Orchesella cincta]|uniref:Uncharacterized protein n=1 Tax=Orchesella cincta TaxID=48709 RepID=A0A1D2MZA0_ORCCI|nr:hypothetical protein Ocin01_08417 [Orchesella cincta]